MEFLTAFLQLSSFIWTIFHFIRSNYWYKKPAKLPPGPLPVPIIRNILKLGPNPHQSLAKLSKTYGPLMHLKLGNIQTIVVSSPEIAKQILQTHDKIFSGRAVPYAAQAMGHDKASVAWLPTESKWRKFRKICKEQMFTMRKLEASEGLRQEKLKQLRDYLHESCTSKRVVNIGEVAFDLIVAGTDTTTDSVQWAMTELLRNHAVIKETFRCHPAGPFLVPHKAEANVEINGYMVPEGAQILVNIWAIGRDSRIWSNPDTFEPERFLDSKIDYRGQYFELIAFGSGKRMCPGLPLAHVMVHLMVASLIHNFDWKLEPGMKPEELDLNEMFGLSLHKAVPLKAFPIYQ